MRYNKGEFRDWLAQMRLMNNYLLHSWVQTWWKATSSKGLNWINLKIFFFYLYEGGYILFRKTVCPQATTYIPAIIQINQKLHTRTHTYRQKVVCVCVCMCLCEWDMLSGGNLPYTLTT